MSNRQILHRILVKNAQAAQSSGAPGSAGSALVSPQAQRQTPAIFGDTGGGYDVGRGQSISGDPAHKLRSTLDRGMSQARRANSNMRRALWQDRGPTGP